MLLKSTFIIRCPVKITQESSLFVVLLRKKEKRIIMLQEGCYLDLTGGFLCSVIDLRKTVYYHDFYYSFSL